jgi:hypothetical protein
LHHRPHCHDCGDADHHHCAPHIVAAAAAPAGRAWFACRQRRFRLCVCWGRGICPAELGTVGTGTVAWHCFPCLNQEAESGNVVKVLLEPEGACNRIATAWCWCCELSVHHMAAREQGWHGRPVCHCLVWLLITHVCCALLLADG